MAPPIHLRVALDWTPNTLHAPLLLAKSLKYYSDAGLDVTFLTPDTDYTNTPARKLQAGKADLALCPSETILAYNTSAHPTQLEAISALLKKDASRIATISAIANLAELRGFRYGSYNARYEDAIVAAAVRNASQGRLGSLEPGEDDMEVMFEKDVGRLDLFDAMKKGLIEATWIFLPWEAVKAKFEGFPINVFEVGKYGVDYGYSPVIARNREQSPNAEVLKAFLAATGRGVKFLKGGKMNEKRAVEIMGQWCPDETDEFLAESLKSVGDYLFDGRMDGKVWEKYVAWLKKEGLLEDGEKNVEYKGLFTNDFHA